MKKFEKFYKETYPVPPGPRSTIFGRDFKNGCERMYRGALEEVLKQIKQSAEQPYLTLQNLMGWIKKELGLPELDCATCNDTQQVGEEIIHKGRSMGWMECPDCVGKKMELK